MEELRADLRQLRQFSVLADALSFRVAAARLHMTQPALSRSIANLERKLGVRLFERDKRHVDLTTAGTALLAPARALLDDADELARAASAFAPARRRQLRVGLYGNALCELTYPVLHAFEDGQPDVEVTLTEIAFDRSIEPLLSGEIDVALLRTPCDFPGVTAVPLFTEPVRVRRPTADRQARERGVILYAGTHPPPLVETFLETAIVVTRRRLGLVPGAASMV